MSDEPAGRGRPSEIVDLIDFPKAEVTNAGIALKRRKWDGPRETVWCASLMDDYSKWADLVDLAPAARIELEKPISPADVRCSATLRRSMGFPRIDAVVWHDDGTVSLIEAKVTSSPSDVCGGVGQLIYYKTLAEQWWGVDVSALILAAPFLPPFVLDSIANVRAPVRFLKVSDGEYNGLAARYQD